MTIKEAIAQVNDLCPNQYPNAKKIYWLSQLDAMIVNDTLNKYSPGEITGFTGYNGDTDEDTALVVPAPYDELYLYYLQAQIDYWNRETAKYNNSITRYNEAFTRFVRYWRNSHESKLQYMKYI